VFTLKTNVMKKQILLYNVIICLFTFNSWSQNNSISLNEKKIGDSTNSLVIDDKIFNPNMKVKYYHVEEIVPMKFGGYKTVYNVSNPKLIRTYDLGPNNKRTVTPVFAEGQQVEIVNLKSDTTLKIENAKISISDAPKKGDSYAYIDIIKTYERVADKGYESIDMLKKIGDSHFFNDELDKAEKCYGKLFSKTSDLEPEYYYRYSIALKSVGKIDKANEYLKKFNQLSSNNTR
jgi:tetratricopeptide (TPR) repeat protein